HGVTKPRKEKLQVYLAEARFVLARPPGSIDLSRYATVPFLERIDPAIKHTLIAPADVVTLTDPKAAHNQNPDRRWCDDKARAICIQSRYQLEGKLPLGIKLANKL